MTKTYHGVEVEHRMSDYHRPDKGAKLIDAMCEEIPERYVDEYRSMCVELEQDYSSFLIPTTEYKRALVALMVPIQRKVIQDSIASRMARESA